METSASPPGTQLAISEPSTAIPATHSTAGITPVLTKTKEPRKPSKSRSTSAKSKPRSSEPAKNKKQAKKHKTTTKTASITHPPPSLLSPILEEHSQEAPIVQDRDDHILSSAQPHRTILSLSPSSGHSQADEPSSPALAPDSPRSPGRANAGVESGGGTPEHPPKKRTEKRKHISPTRPQDHVPPTDPYRYGDPYYHAGYYPYHHYDPYYQRYYDFTYPDEYRRPPYPPPHWYPPSRSPHQDQPGHHPDLPPNREKPSRKRPAAPEPSVPTKKRKERCQQATVDAATVYSGPSGHDIEPASISTVPEDDPIPRGYGDRPSSPSILSTSSQDGESSSSNDSITPIPPPSSSTLENHPPSPSEDYTSYAQLILRMAKTLHLDVEQPPQQI